MLLICVEKLPMYSSLQIGFGFTSLNVKGHSSSEDILQDE